MLEVGLIYSYYHDRHITLVDCMSCESWKTDPLHYCAMYTQRATIYLRGWCVATTDATT